MAISVDLGWGITVIKHTIYEDVTPFTLGILGVPVIDSDIIVHTLFNENEFLYNQE